MQYKIIVDKQPSSNPSTEKKEYVVDIEELRVKGNVYDSLNIEMDRTYVTRRLSLSEYGVPSVLDEPVIEELEDVDIKLFEGDNYIYLSDMEGNHFYAEYVLKNDFTDMYVTKAEMNSNINQTAQSIELSVNQKLENYSTTEEMNSAIEQTAESITSSVSKTYATKENLEDEVTELNSTISQTAQEINSEVSKKVDDIELGTKIIQNWESVRIAWNQISEYIQFIDAMLQIRDSSNNLLMSLNQFGQYFYDNGAFLGLIGASHYSEDSSQKGLAFNLEPSGKFMTWGKKNNTNDESYESKMYYCSANSFGQNEEGIYFNVPIFLSDKLNIEYGTLTSGTAWYSSAWFSDDIKKGFVMLSRNTCEFNLESGVFINGAMVQTNTSDGRLKHKIENSKINAIDRIKQFKHRQFVWNKDNKQENIGYIAQELEKVDKNYVIKNPQYDEDGNIIDYLYQIDLLPVLATATKAISELKEELDEKDKITKRQQEFLSIVAEKIGIQQEYNNLFNSINTQTLNIINDDEETDYGQEIRFSKNWKRAKPDKLIIDKNGKVKKEVHHD